MKYLADLFSNKDVKIKLIGVGLFLFYLTIGIWEILPIELIGLNWANIPSYLKIVYLIFFESMFMLFLIFVYKGRLIVDFKDIQKNIKNYFNEYLKYWFIALGLMMISNYFIMLIYGERIAANEESIRELMKVAPLYIIFSAVIFAPIVEELIFRLTLRNIFSIDWIFILISGLIFGSMHILSAANIWKEALYIIPYSIPGFIFAYVLIKSKNIFVPIGLHFIHNSFLVALQFLVLLFK